MTLQEVLDTMSRYDKMSVIELDIFYDVWKALDYETDINLLTVFNLGKALSKSTQNEDYNKRSAEYLVNCLYFASTINSLNKRPTFTALDLMRTAKSLNKNFKMHWQDEAKIRGKQG